MKGRRGCGMLRPMMQRMSPWLALVAVLAFASTAGALGSGGRAPAIGLQDLAGRPVALEGLRGKVVLVDFWASWCGPCREELPVLESFHVQYKPKGLVVIGVNIDNDAQNMKEFLRREKLSFTIVPDAKREVAGRYEPTKMPSSYLIDKKGIVRHVHAGFKRADAVALEAEIKALLAE